MIKEFKHHDMLVYDYSFMLTQMTSQSQLNSSDLAQIVLYGMKNSNMLTWKENQSGNFDRVYPALLLAKFPQVNHSTPRISCLSWQMGVTTYLRGFPVNQVIKCKAFGSCNQKAFRNFENGSKIHDIN